MIRLYLKYQPFLYDDFPNHIFSEDILVDYQTGIIRYKNTDYDLDRFLGKPFDIDNDSFWKKFKIANEDKANPLKYFGFTAADGSWYITKIENGTYRYACGLHDFEINWNERADQEYEYLELSILNFL